MQMWTLLKIVKYNKRNSLAINFKAKFIERCHNELAI